MFVWDCLRGERAIAQVVPDAYAAYRRPIAAALEFYLENLPAPRAAAIVGEQLSLDPSAGAAERLTILARACPVLHKLGQVLARDRRLDPGMRGQLQRLESMPPRVPITILREHIERELGPLQRLGLSLEPEALAEASVAVVVPFAYRDGADDDVGLGRGVFKLIKPGVEERLGQDLALLEDVGAFLDERCARFGHPSVGLPGCLCSGARAPRPGGAARRGAAAPGSRPRGLRGSRGDGPGAPPSALVVATGHGDGADRRPEGDRARGRPVR